MTDERQMRFPDFPVPEPPDMPDTAQPHAHARRSDPPTSHAAAASVDSIRASQAEILRILRDFGPCDDETLVRLVHDHGTLPMSVSGTRTRRSELVRLGLVHDTGRRVLTQAGRHSIVWQVSEPGPPA